MVNPRLLSTALAIASTFALTGCLGIHVSPVMGRVVDDRTGEGVAGAEIFRTYGTTNYLQVMGEPSGHSFTPDWTTTSADGTFSFPGKWVLEFGVIDEPPLMPWIHRDYGWGSLVVSERTPQPYEIRADHDDEEVAYLKSPTRLPPYEPCDAVSSEEAFARCETVVHSGARQVR